MVKKAARTAGRMHTALERLANLPKVLQLVWVAARGWTALWFALLLIQGLIPAATIYATKVLVDAVAIASQRGFPPESHAALAVPLVVLGALLLTAQILWRLVSYVHQAQSELLQDHIKVLTHGKSVSVDLAFYENPADFDRLERVNTEAGRRSLSLLENLGSFIENVISLVAIGAVLMTYGAWIPVVLILSTLPALWVVLKHNRLHHDWWEATTAERRWADYYDKMLTLPAPAPEIRLFGLADRFRDAYLSRRRGLRESRLRLMRAQNVATLGASVSALAVTGAAMVWMIWRAAQGSATLGDLALFYQAFNQGQALVRTLLSSAGQLYTNLLFLDHLFAFLKIQPEVVSPADPVRFPRRIERGITFHNVGFKYPGSEHFVLHDFDIAIQAGTTVAIVGPNGAGKSTLVKLLCRFYDPQEGQVFFDGVNARKFDVDDLRRNVTAMFQHPIQYVASASENVAIGELNRMEIDRVRSAVSAGGAEAVIEQLPRGYDTLLNKQFEGGVELSSGQWQRITLARAFYRRAPIVVLDEPTSFMDSWAEMQWLARFRELVKGRTAIIITHRFTTAMRADTIHVMAEGRIVESGTHAELLALGGSYAESWLAQMQAGDVVGV